MDPDGYRAALDGRDAVVHLAAVLRSTDDDEIRRANLEATRRLAGAALDAGVARFVFTSTNLVYPGGLGFARPARTTSRRRRPPGARIPPSKVEAERALLALHRDRGLGPRIVRLAFVYPRATRIWPSRCGGRPVARAPAAAADPPRRRGSGGRPRPARPGNRRADLQRGRRVAGHRGGAALNGVPFPDSPAGDADLWHGVVDTTRIRQELGFRPWYPSVWSARDAGAL